MLTGDSRGTADVVGRTVGGLDEIRADLRPEDKASIVAELVLYELATNSLKYGAPSTATGSLDLSQCIKDKGFVLLWTERCGPPVTAPEGVGAFGCTLIRRSVVGQLGSSIECDWSRDGVVIAMHIDPARLA